MEIQPSITGRKAMEQELIEGRDMANQLLEVLVIRKSNNDIHGGQGDEEEERLILPFAEDLVRKVLRSFTNALLLLNTNNDDSVDHVVEPVPIVTTRDFSSSANCPKLEDMDEICKRIPPRNRRGCHKRKTIAPTWEKDGSILIEDGHAWRKYGQKMTMNAKYLRNYYRCSHKGDQGCQATKHEQRIQEEPPLYRTTYYGHHTCSKTPLIHPDIMVEPAFCSAVSDSSILLSFNNSNSLSLPSKQKEHYPFSSSTKQEPPLEEVIIPDDHIHAAHNSQLSLSDNCLLLCDYELNFNYSGHVTNMLSSTQSAVEFDNVFGPFGF